MFGRTADYALRALLYLARNGREGGYERARVIARAAGMPANYAGKVLNTLAREGLLESARGPTGGFRLGVAPEKLTAAAVVDLFEAPAPNPRCILGTTLCNPRRPCAAHIRWAAVLEAQRAPLTATTIADLASAPTN
ncbi:MAG: Rrf2 family transcriptional regulator [Gemmatimonadota bacterium]|nr:Rrf2 family transcriptional regulator [Gemmatimonadota bacterium]